MKKVLAMAAIALFMMTSCSDDSSDSTNNENTSDVLLKKSIQTFADGETFTSTFTYDGNRPTGTIFSDGTKDIFTYNSEGLMSKISTYEGTELIMDEIFEYDSNNKIASHVFKDYIEDYVSKTLYTHNTNGTISTEEFTGTLAEQSQWGTILITLENGNVTKSVTTFLTSPDNPDVTTFTYDTKNSPTKNVFGREVLNIVFLSYGVNNVLTGTNDDDGDTTYTYTYNADGYPVTEIYNVDSELSSTTQYFYE